MLPVGFSKTIKDMCEENIKKQEFSEYSIYQRNIQERITTAAMSGSRKVTLDFHFEVNMKKATSELQNAGFEVKSYTKDRYFLEVLW